MKSVKKEDKKVRLSITLSAKLKGDIDNNTSNRSGLIERVLLEYLTKSGFDTKKIKL